MKKKEFKRFESVAFIMLEVLAKAVEMKKLQLEEKKLNIDRELWIEQRSGQKVGSSFLSGGVVEKEFVINKRSENHSKDALLMALEAGIKDGTIQPIKLDELNFEIIGGIDFGKLPKEINDEAVKKGFESEKRCQTAFDLIDKASPVGEPKKTNVDFQFPKRNFGMLSPADNYFFVDRNKWKMFFGDTEKELFCFEDRDSRKIITLKTRNEVEFAIAQNLEIYFKWVRR